MPSGESTSIWHVLVNNLPAILTAFGVLAKSLIDSKRLRAEIAALKKDRDAQAKRNADLDRENQELHDQIAALTTSVTERDDHLDKLQKSFDFLLIEYKRQIDKNEMFAAQVNELRTTNELLKRQYDELCAENETLRKQLAAVAKKQTGSLKE